MEYGELWKKIKDLIRPASNNSSNYVGKCMKIRFNSDDSLLLKEH